MLRAKSLWRVIGTIVAALCTIFVLAKLPRASFALGIAISLWIGLYMYLMLATHAPHNYAFMLTGHTTVLIMFPSLTLHERLPPIAFTRTAEVWVGCLSAWIFSELFATRKAGKTALLLLNAWQADACTYYSCHFATSCLFTTPLPRTIKKIQPLVDKLLNALDEDSIIAIEKNNADILQADYEFSIEYPDLVDVRPYIRRLHLFT